VEGFPLPLPLLYIDGVVCLQVCRSNPGFAEQNERFLGCYPGRLALLEIRLLSLFLIRIARANPGAEKAGFLTDTGSWGAIQVTMDGALD